MENYQKLNKLGEGTYGVVFKAKDLRKDDFVAMKIMHVEEEEEGVSVTALREIALMKKLHHTNILRLREAFYAKNSVTMITDYLEIDLCRYMSISKGPMNEKLLQSYAYQILCGICYLHGNRVMHRDIKPSNLLLNKDGILKICDFGLSRLYSVPAHQYTSDVITLWYRSFELLVGVRDYDISCDIWSAGCIIAEMVSGKPLFAGDTAMDQIYKIISILGTPNEENFPYCNHMKECFGDFPLMERKNLKEVLGTNDDDLIDLIDQMLVYNPKARISALRALKHPYFNTISQQIVDMCLPDGIL